MKRGRSSWKGEEQVRRRAGPEDRKGGDRLHWTAQRRDLREYDVKMKLIGREGGWTLDSGDDDEELLDDT